MPIFETSSGETIALEELNPRFMLPEFHGSDRMSLGDKTILKRPRIGCESLYSLLDIKPLPRAEHYAITGINLQIFIDIYRYL